MRGRYLVKLRVPIDWQTKAGKAQADVDAGKKKLSDCSDVWGELKPALAAMSYGKCWYCEARQIRDDNAVDHFRPKSKYPWLAFDPLNYRFACTFCNSVRKNPETGETEGKGDYFGLLNEDGQASNEAELDRETPVLLDPCSATDCAALDFKLDGTACSANLPDETLRKRVVESIKRYHLDHPGLNEERRVLGFRIERWIKSADRLYPKIEAANDPAGELAFRNLAETLLRSMDDHEALSAFAKRMIRIHRTRPWVEQLLFS